MNAENAIQDRLKAELANMWPAVNKRHSSTEDKNSINHENGLGRGSRMRKKRKFFDEERDEDEEDEEVNESVRQSVFQTEFSRHGSVVNNHLLPKKLKESFPQPLRTWNANTVAEFAQAALNADFADDLGRRLIFEEVDGEALHMLAKEDLITVLGMKLGPALKLFNAIRSVKE